MLLGDDHEVVSRREAEEERRDLEYEANEAIGKMEDRAIEAEKALARAQGEIKALEGALDQVRARAEKAEGLLQGALWALVSEVTPCPTTPCPVSPVDRGRVACVDVCVPCWREEINRRLAAKQTAAAAAGRGR